MKSKEVGDFLLENGWANLVLILFGSVGLYFFPIYILPVVVIALILGEIIFLRLDGKPKKRENILTFTIEQKIMALFISFPVSFLFVGIGIVIWASIIQALENWVETFAFVQTICFWIGCIAVLCVGAYVYFKLNSLKYRNIEKESKRRRKNETK